MNIRIKPVRGGEGEIGGLMGDQGAGNDVRQKMEKRKKLKKVKTDEESVMQLLEIENFGRNEVSEHEQRSQIEDITEMNRKRRRNKEKKKNKEVKDAEVVDMDKDSSYGQLICVYGEDGCGDAMNISAGNQEKRKKKKSKNEACYLPRFEVGKLEANEVLEKPVEEKVSELKSSKEAKKERKKQKIMEIHNDGDIEGRYEDREQGGTFGDKIDGSVTEKVKRKKRKRERMNSKDDDCIKSQGDPTPSKINKKVSFSGEVEVFPLPDDSDTEKIYDEENLVRGKRFTPEENEIVKEAVYRFIQDHDLGEDGLNMVLNCKNHPELRGCWKEIAAAIPYRPYTAVYYRAQVIFRRSASRKWTQEEYDMILKYQELHGNEWKALADELGKHRWHVKDTWRRIKLRNMNKGQWTQKEYQNLFNLVNIDLQQKLSEEKRSKHGMLRDNICWTAISDKLSTRAQANCCIKWYKQLTSPMVAEGLWADTDDYRLLQNLYRMDAGCMEDVDWDSLLDHRSGDLCRKRWNQMVLHIGSYGNKPYSEQVDVLAQRYCPQLLEARETWDNKPRVP